MGPSAKAKAKSKAKAKASAKKGGTKKATGTPVFPNEEEVLLGFVGFLGLLVYSGGLLVLLVFLS